MDKAAIVTGASSGIGFEISKKLCKLGYEVFGIGRTFAPPKFCREELDTERFHEIPCDLLDTDHLLCAVKQIMEKHSVSVLVNNAGIAYYGLHEELNAKKIKQMVRTNLEVPMILTQQLLRMLKQNRGYIINISSVTAQSSNPHGCAYGATKAGLYSFSRSLFDETRKYGVKTVTIFLDMTKTELYRNADFTVGEEEESYLLPQEAAQAVEEILSRKEGVIVSELTIKPQLHRIQRKKKELCRN